MAAINLKDLNFENVGTWPTPIKAAAIAIVCVVIMGLVYWFDTSAQFARLELAQTKEVSLRQEFESKQHQAVNIQMYRQQLANIRSVFGTMLRQLPSGTEVPGLLEDISRSGVQSGLHFRLFAPQKEIPHDFYAELPIKIAVVGDYHQLATFVSKVAALSRIVTLHDFEIQSESKANPSLEKSDKLLMSITANIYRYKEE